jgi:nucleoid DNA-binding protein
MTGEELKIAASRVPAFKPRISLKAALSGKDK